MHPQQLMKENDKSKLNLTSCNQWSKKENLRRKYTAIEI